MDDNCGRFNYIYSAELDAEFEIKIGSLEGKRNRPSYHNLIEQDSVGYFSGSYQGECSDLRVTVQVFNNGLPITLPVQTSHKSFTTRWNWNEWLSLPIKFSDLPRDAIIAFTIWDYYGTEGMVPIGATTISVFGKRGTLRKGMHDLKVWPDRRPDPKSQSDTPGKSKDASDRMSQLSKLTKKHRDGHMTKIDWLDRLTFREIELVNEQEKRDSECMYLMVEFPTIHYEGQSFSVVYFEKEGDKAYEFRTQAELCTIHDPELLMENIVESKHHKLARSLRSGQGDKDLKPDASTRDLLNKIVGYPPTKTLSSEEQDLVWKFRYYLSSQKEALAKFLKSVNWKLPQESTAALEMLLSWSPMNVEDALELLSPAFTHPRVRKYAIRRLGKADDEDLLLYLLQLVQALKYENFEEINNRADRDYILTRPEFDSSRIDGDFLSLQPSEIVVGLDQHPLSQSNLSSTSTTSISDDESKARADTVTTEEKLLDAMNYEKPVDALDDEMDLATFLISRACKNPVIANYFYWYLIVEIEGDKDIQKEEVQNMYKTVLKRFSVALSKGPSQTKKQRAILARQQAFMKKLCGLVESLNSVSSRQKKIELLQAMLHKPEIAEMTSNSEPIPLPLDPSIRVKSIIPEKATVFASKLSPCLFTFETDSGKEYKAIFKYGDDLRQDQLILQMFQLMDKLLRYENLDLQMTPYKVLATSKEHGFVQFIESVALSELSKEKAIQKYLRQYNPSETGPFGIVPEVMDNYVKSCAGYCVVTYLLQVGDRHLDNLLLTKNGKMFHIDFGFILGRDPKIMAPPMKLNKQMVEAMGGYDSEHFQKFKVYTYTAFLALRRSANLFLNLFSLMIDSNIPDIALEPDKTVKKVQEKFMLHLNDEQAVQHIQQLIADSVNALMPTLIEYGHKMAQVLRK